MKASPLFFAGSPGRNYGWGICNRHLLEELSKLTTVTAIEPNTPSWHDQNLPGDLFTPVPDHHLTPITPARGQRNFGYTFFENDLPPSARENARQYEVIFAGCSWCCERLRDHGIPQGQVLIQGVDHSLFHPQPPLPKAGQFLVFSGGKFELRKGQDLVLKALGILQQKYADLILVNAWYNQWAHSVATMSASRHIQFQTGSGSWIEQVEGWCRLNGLDPRRVVTLPLLPQEQMARIYHLTDLGLFPNRCEGGTNLVMMEYLACGKPVVASWTSGHRDVLTPHNAFLLTHLRPFRLANSRREILARWEEASIDEIVAQVEYAYHHRDEAERRGRRAAEDMRSFSWNRTAQTILDVRSATA